MKTARKPKEDRRLNAAVSRVKKKENHKINGKRTTPTKLKILWIESQLRESRLIISHEEWCSWAIKRLEELHKTDKTIHVNLQSLL